MLMVLDMRLVLVFRDGRMLVAMLVFVRMLRRVVLFAMLVMLCCRFGSMSSFSVQLDGI